MQLLALIRIHPGFDGLNREHVPYLLPRRMCLYKHCLFPDGTISMVNKAKKQYFHLNSGHVKCDLC